VRVKGEEEEKRKESFRVLEKTFATEAMKKLDLTPFPLHSVLLEGVR